MDIERLQDQSIYYWLKSLLPTFVSVVDAFPANYTSVDTSLAIPAVSIDSVKINAIALELGGLEINERAWVIDIFGKTKSQRDDFTTLLLNALKLNIPVFDYNQGFPPAVVPCVGNLIVNDIQARPVYVFRDLVKDLYWRSSVTFTTVYQSYN